MATSGSTSVAVTSYNSLVFSWKEVSQSVSSNSTTISWELKLVATGAGAIISSTPKSWTVTVNGTLYKGTNRISLTDNASITLASGTSTITHNSDGTKTFSYTFSQEFAITFAGEYIGTISGSGSGKLDTIYRNSSLSVSNGTLGTAMTLTVSRKSSSFTHTITYSCGSASGTICTKSASTSISWTPPNELASQAPNANSVSVKFTMTTYNGSSSLGSVSKTITCDIPYTNTFVPVLLPTITDASGYADTYGWIQGHSQLQVDIETYGAYGATIQSVRTEFEGMTFTSEWFISNPIATAGALPIKITVTDSRGRTSEVNPTITVLPYEFPKVEGVTACRCDADGSPNPSGSYLLMEFSATASPLNGNNTVTYYVGYKKVSETNHTAVELTEFRNSYSVNSQYIVPAETNSSYTLIFTVSDALKQIRTVITGPSVKKVWSMLKKNGDIVGMAFGKIAEHEGVFDIGWQVKFSGGGDCVVEAGDKNGWTYRKWDSGVAECWKILTHRTTITVAWGALYHGTATTRQSYPFNFVGKPVEHACLTAGSYQAILFPEKDGNGVNGASASACYNVCRPSSMASTMEFYIALHVVGKWK